MSIQHNALNQRIIKSGPLSPRFLFFYDPSVQLIGEYQDNAATTTPADDWLVRQETIWLESIPVAVLTKPTATGPIKLHYIHADHLNTPRVIVDQSNTIVWRWENTHTFGANLPNEAPDSNGQLFEYHPRFPGQYFDKETGLHYNYFRYYPGDTFHPIRPDWQKERILCDKKPVDELKALPANSLDKLASSGINNAERYKTSALD